MVRNVPPQSFFFNGYETGLGPGHPPRPPRAPIGPDKRFLRGEMKFCKGKGIVGPFLVHRSLDCGPPPPPPLLQQACRAPQCNRPWQLLVVVQTANTRRRHLGPSPSPHTHRCVELWSGAGAGVGGWVVPSEPQASPHPQWQRPALVPLQHSVLHRALCTHTIPTVMGHGPCPRRKPACRSEPQRRRSRSGDRLSV